MSNWSYSSANVEYMTQKINTSTRGEKKPKDWKHFQSIDDARQEVLIS